MGVRFVMQRQLLLAVCAILVFCACFGLLWIDYEWIFHSVAAVSTTTIKDRRDAGNDFSCAYPSDSMSDYCGNNATSIWNPIVASNYSQLLAIVGEGRRNMEKHLATDYGSYYRSLFYDEAYNSSRGKLAAYDPSHPHGWESLIRRLQLKILHVQEQVLLHEEEQIQHFELVQRNKKIFSRIWKGNSKVDKKIKRTPSSNNLHKAPWIFAVSGHSSSAGHGNFDSQSYASVMENALSPLLESLGIAIETRNYGMSGKASAPEVALCQEAFYGTDVDVLTWDSALTDQPWFFEYWTQRAANGIANRPVLLAAHAGGRRHVRANVFERVWDQNGPFMPMMIMNEAVVGSMEAAVPDSLHNTNLPPLLMYLKCGNGDKNDDSNFLEVNEPCKSEKFDVSACPDRYWRVPWHPGYRRLALYGNLLALMHVDAIEEAVRELIILFQTTEPLSVNAKVTSRQVQQIKELLEEQECRAKENQKATRTEIPTIGDQDWPKLIPGVPPNWYFHSPSLCRTARLPSQHRFKGILTGRSVPYHNANSFVPIEGREQKQIRDQIETTETNLIAVDDLGLGYDWSSRVSQNECNSSRIKRDFSDYFYVTNREWRRAILPSAAEWNEYGREDNDAQNPNAHYHGLLFICPLLCEKQRKLCTGDELGGDWSRVEWQVNGLAAHAHTKFISEDCALLSRHPNDSDEVPSTFIFPPREDGTWELKVRIKPLSSGGENDDIKIFQINSIVLV